MKTYIPCRCGCDIMVIDKIAELEDEGDLFYFNMYRSQHPGGIWYRLKNAWEYFLKGEFAYSDMTIETKDIDKIIDFLVKAKGKNGTMKVDYFQSIQKLDIKDGDVIVLKCKQRLSPEAFKNLKEAYQTAMEGFRIKDIKVLILEEGIDIGVLRGKDK